MRVTSERDSIGKERDRNKNEIEKIERGKKNERGRKKKSHQKGMDKVTSDD